MAKNRKLVIIIIVLLLSTVGRFGFVSVKAIPGKYFDRPLPDNLPHWQALEIYTCSECTEIIQKEVDEKIMKRDPNTSMFLAVGDPDIKDGKCPFHGIDMSSTKTTWLPTSPAVVKALPDDTEYDNRYYYDNDIFTMRNAHLIHTTVVTSGADKRSIHRTERCLKSQANQLISRKRMWLDIPGSKKKKIDVVVIRIRRPMKKSVLQSVAMYWYVGHNRITADNFKRLGYMAWDRMILGQNYRWSYVLMVSHITKSYQDTEEAMFQFIREFFSATEK